VRSTSLVILLAAAAAAVGVRAAPVSVQVSDTQGKPVAGAVVYLDSPAAARATRPLAQVEVIQAQRQFVPQVALVTRGTPVLFPNQDTVRHHVYSLSPAKRFELKLYLGKPAAPVVFDQPGVAVLGCNIHDQMVGYVVIVDTPYHARTDAAGRATLDAPAGDYRLRTWHADFAVGAPALDQPLTVAAVPMAASVRWSRTLP
jgi:plastocyanin